jgi:hypothetical protein
MMRGLSSKGFGSPSAGGEVETGKCIVLENTVFPTAFLLLSKIVPRIEVG